MIRLLRYRHDELPSDLKWQAVSYMRVEWPFINGGMLRETYPAELRPVHFALVEDDLLLSYAATFRLRVEHAGEEYEMEGFGNVFTYPASRRKGYGRRVVEAAAGHIRGSHADVAVLFCQPELEGFYAASGWEASREAGTVVAGEGEPKEHDALRMMLVVSEKGAAGRPDFSTLPLHIPFPW